MRRATRTPFGSFTQVAPCPTCEGSGQVIADPCNACGGQGLQQVRKKLRINIPAGVDTGTRLRVANEGNAGQRGGPAGDLYVFLTVQSHPQLRRDGINIHSEVVVNYLQAILGDTIEVETVDGSEQLEIPAGTQPGAVLTLTGKGVPKLGNPVARGNHLIATRIERQSGQHPTRLGLPVWSTQPGERRDEIDALSIRARAAGDRLRLRRGGDQSKTIAQPLHRYARGKNAAFQRVADFTPQPIGDRRQQLLRRTDLGRAGMGHDKTAGPIGALAHARVDAGLSDERGLLVPRDAKDRHVSPEPARFGHAKIASAVPYLRQERGRNVKERKQVRTPALFPDIEQHRA